jgi:hypothetical protein
MDEMEFKLNETVILNEKVALDLPMRVGQRGVIFRKSTFSNFEFDVECDDGEVLPLKTSELNKLTEQDKQYMNYIFTKNKVRYHNQEVTIVKTDYLHFKAEILIGEVEDVVDFDKLQPIHIDSLEEVKVDNSRETKHRQVIEEIHKTFKIKNADYGNSFGEQFAEYGLLSAVIRLDDKMRRSKQLMKQDAKVKDESIRDTFLDLANYAIMTVMELDGYDD